VFSNKTNKSSGLYSLVKRGIKVLYCPMYFIDYSLVKIEDSLENLIMVKIKSLSLEFEL